jgi:hypothetical protein
VGARATVRVRKISPAPEFDTRTVQPVASNSSNDNTGVLFYLTHIICHFTAAVSVFLESGVDALKLSGLLLILGDSRRI